MNSMTLDDNQLYNRENVIYRSKLLSNITKSQCSHLLFAKIFGLKFKENFKTEVEYLIYVESEVHSNKVLMLFVLLLPNIYDSFKRISIYYSLNQEVEILKFLKSGVMFPKQGVPRPLIFYTNLLCKALENKLLCGALCQLNNITFEPIQVTKLAPIALKTTIKMHGITHESISAIISNISDHYLGHNFIDWLELQVDANKKLLYYHRVLDKLIAFQSIPIVELEKIEGYEVPIIHSDDKSRTDQRYMKPNFSDLNSEYAKARFSQGLKALINIAYKTKEPITLAASTNLAIEKLCKLIVDDVHVLYIDSYLGNWIVRKDRIIFCDYDKFAFGPIHYDLAHLLDHGKFLNSQERDDLLNYYFQRMNKSMVGFDLDKFKSKYKVVSSIRIISTIYSYLKILSERININKDITKNKKKFEKHKYLYGAHSIRVEIVQIISYIQNSVETLYSRFCNLEDNLAIELEPLTQIFKEIFRIYQLEEILGYVDYIFEHPDIVLYEDDSTSLKKDVFNTVLNQLIVGDLLHPDDVVPTFCAILKTDDNYGILTEHGTANKIWTEEDIYI